MIINRIISGKFCIISRILIRQVIRLKSYIIYINTHVYLFILYKTKIFKNLFIQNFS